MKLNNRLSKNGLVSLIAVATMASALAQSPLIPIDVDLENKVSGTLSSMSLDEKIGQMIQLEVGMITYRDPQYSAEALAAMSEEELDKTIRHFGLEKQYVTKDVFLRTDEDRANHAKVMNLYWLSNDIISRLPFSVGKSELDTVIGKYKVGSIINPPQVTAQTPRLWNKLVSEVQKVSLRDLRIPAVYGLDQVHGATYSKGGTLFPGNINMAATFNPELAFKMGEIVAYETRACDVPWIFDPVVDLGRHQAWSRQYEGFGEDVYLSSVMGVNVVKGMQGPDPNHIDRYHVASCPKHFFAYGATYNGLDRSPAYLPYEELRGRHFVPFLECFRAGALTTMTNSANVNGQKGLVNRDFLTGWLKVDLDWDGVIVTDWGDIDGAVNCDHVAPTVKDAICMAVNAGVDMMMVPSQLSYNAMLRELVEEGRVDMDRIDDAVRRILRLKYRLGLFDVPDTFASDYPKYGSEEFAAYSRQAAVESQVLLKNSDNVLPIAKGKRILVAGPNANSIRTLCGGWSYTWQGDGGDNPEFVGQYNTIYEALANKFGKQNVTLVEGVSYDPKQWSVDYADNIADAVAAAKDADYIVACVGENSYAEVRGNIADLNLNANQKQLVRELAATGKPVILILNGGRGRIISDIEPLASAIVNIMLPGNYGGDALAELLAGDENFSGRLPYTYSASPNAMVNYDYKASEVREKISGVYDYDAKTYEQWWFGAGLSYTSFEYSDFKVDKSTFGPHDQLSFSIDVKNTGERKGKEVVMLFSSDVYASMMPDNRRLRSFDKIELSPGEKKTVSFSVPASALAFVGADGRWTLEEGLFRISCGSCQLEINCDRDYKWLQSNIPNF